MIGGDLGYVKFGIFPGDSGTFSITLAAAPDDDPMRAVLRGPGFDAATHAIPMLIEWVKPEVSTPISEVNGMANLNDVRRYMVENSEPLALGIVAIDASPALVAAEPGAFLYGDIHMTAKGHAALAEAIAKALRNLEFLARG